MTRLIDADELKKALKSNCKPELCHDINTAWCERCCRTNDFEDLIDEAPTVKPDMAQGTLDAMHAHERPKGEWILKEPDYDNDGGNNLYECNNCHHYDTHSDSKEVPYCWFCGADMREADT